MKLSSSILVYPSLLLLLTSKAVVGHDNGLALTPPMGWNTWNGFGCNVDEDLIAESAKVVAEKFKVYGYECACSNILKLEPRQGHSLIFSSFAADIVVDDCP